MNLGIFREYDIRARAEEELTDEIVYQIGSAFGTYLSNQERRHVVLGRDNRLSSERIAGALTDGILSTGCDVIDVGETTTPVLCFSIAYLQVDGGVMVTGSHNPPEFNGIKLQVGERPLYGQTLRNLVQIIESSRFAQGNGSLSTQDVLPLYFKRVKERIGLQRPLKVVVDCGNGNTSLIAPRLFRDLGCDVIPLYCENDGRFPHHHPDPAVPDNLRDLMEEVKRRRADVGIAYDGDGNRIGVVDDTGCIISPDILLGLLARDILRQRGPVKIVCEVKASQALIEDVEKRGGTVVMCKVGYPFLLETMFTENAALAGELTGHICYNEGLFAFGDAVFVSCRLLELLSRTSRSVSQLLSDFPQYFSTPELRIPCSDDRKLEVVQEVRRYFGKRYKALTIDGIRIFLGNQSWALIRASNTEPVLSVRFEAKTESDLEHVKSIVVSQLRSVGVIGIDI
jgi:phosphomannomutase/phosphoglucomutase